MTFEEYQKISRENTSYPDDVKNVLKNEHRFVFPVLGLAGETGEVAEKIKKVIRDHQGIIDEEKKNELVKELGDILWYLTQLATDLNISLEEIAKANLEKLKSRRERGKIHGSGDNR